MSERMLSIYFKVKGQVSLFLFLFPFPAVEPKSETRPKYKALISNDLGSHIFYYQASLAQLMATIYV